MQINPISYSFNIPQNKGQQKNNSQNAISFKGTNVESKFFEPVKKPFRAAIEGLAKTFGKILSTDSFSKVLKVAQNEKYGSPVQHFSAFIGLVIAGTYVKKTLSNEKLDSQKRTTLAINQGIVAGLGTVLGYVVTNKINKQVDRFTNRFEAVSAKERLKNLKRYEKELPDLLKHKDGMKAASEMIIFALIYRYISPVIVTPIANHIGNKIQAKKEARMAGGQ